MKGFSVHIQRDVLPNSIMKRVAIVSFAVIARNSVVWKRMPRGFELVQGTKKTPKLSIELLFQLCVIKIYTEEALFAKRWQLQNKGVWVQ
mmetsp:Transcript_11401/g.32839  ORF Transcript_11401/g.32839 Transcript_11401/m.32839 type:complete len:90 (+) Transcript_11401:7-276(+)